MSKAIGGAVLIAGAAAGFLLMDFATGGLGALVNTPAFFALIGSLAAGGVSMEAGAIADALTSNRGMNITTRAAAGLRQVIYGMQRVGGTVIYQSTTGAGGSGGNYIYNYIIAIATHLIDGYVNIYLDGRQVYWSQTANRSGYRGNIGCGTVAVPPTATASLTGGRITGITATGGLGFADVKPMDGYRVRISGGGGSGAVAWATNSGSVGSPVWNVAMEAEGGGYTSQPDIDIQGAYTFGGYGAADQQDPSQPGYGLGYGIGPNGQHYDFAGKVYCEVRFGDQLPGDYMKSLSDNDPNWGPPAISASQAQFSANLTDGIITSYTRITGGSGYVGPDFIESVFGSGGAIAMATVTVAGGECTAMTPISQTGIFTSTPTVGVPAPTNVPPGDGAPGVLGCAYIYLNVGYDTAQFQNAPEIRITVTGKNDIYDPRTQKTGYSINWALQVADVIGNMGNGNEPPLGLGDGPITAWPEAAIDQLIAAANVCDEDVLTSQGTTPQWTQHMRFDTSTSPGDQLAMMMPSAAGRLSRVGGGWMIYPAYWQGPSFSFDQSALVGPVQWTPYRSFKDLFNCVNGTYTAPNYPYSTKNTGGIPGQLYDKNGWYYGTIDDVWPFAFQPTSFPQYAQDVLHGYSANEWLEYDGGTVLPKELSLHGVLDIVQAQRASKVVLLRNRYQASGSFPMQLAAWQMQPTDVMAFSMPALGLADAILEVDSIHFMVEEQEHEGGVEAGGSKAMAITLQVSVNQTDPSIYEWSEDEELTAYDVPAAPSQIPYQAAPPTGMTVASSPATAYIGTDGVTHPRALVSWTAPEDITVKQIQLQYQLEGATAWTDGGTVDVSLFSAYVGPLVSGLSYNFQIRSLRGNGASSDWVQEFGLLIDSSYTFVSASLLAVAPPGTVVRDTSGPTEPFGHPYSIWILPFTAVWGNQSVACLTAGRATVTGLAWSVLYYVYYIDLDFAGGAITPIATTNLADFYLKPGYWFIGTFGLGLNAG